MKIKSYFARTVEAAMAAARQELGGDAMLVNSRRSPPESRHLGEYEVVFALDVPAADAAPNPTSTDVTDRISIELSNLKNELEGMRKALTRTAMAPAQWIGTPPELSDG